MSTEAALLDRPDVAGPVARGRSTRRGNGKFLVGGVLLGVFVLAAIAPTIFTGIDPQEQDILNRLAPPGGGHLLGTDELGRDEFSRLIHAIRVDLRVGVLGALLPMVIGAAIGTAAALGGRALDMGLMRIADAVIAFPILVFFLVLVGLLGPGGGFWFLGPGEPPVLIGFAAIGWVVYARLLRSEIRRVTALGYVEAARAGGLSRTRVVTRHVLPNAAGQIVVYVCVDMGLAILALSSLSFLGLGVPAPRPELGSMIAASSTVLATNWWLVIAPGAVIALLGMALALLGDGIDDRLKGS